MMIMNSQNMMIISFFMRNDLSFFNETEDEQIDNLQYDVCFSKTLNSFSDFDNEWKRSSDDDDDDDRDIEGSDCSESINDYDNDKKKYK